VLVRERPTKERNTTELKRQIENDNDGGKNAENDNGSDRNVKSGNGGGKSAENAKNENSENAKNENRSNKTVESDDGRGRNAENDNRSERNVKIRRNAGREIIQIGIRDIQANSPMLMNRHTTTEGTPPVRNFGSLSSLQQYMQLWVLRQLFEIFYDLQDWTQRSA